VKLLGTQFSYIQAKELEEIKDYSNKKEFITIVTGWVELITEQTKK